MFQKSCLFKCIQTSNKFNESIDVLKLNSQLDATTETTSSQGKHVNKKTHQWSITLKKRLNLKMQSNKKQITFKQSSYDTYNDDEDDDDDDDDSDMSFESFYNNNDDLNSSLSSVSSLEFEPFEVIPLAQKKNIKARVSVTSSSSSPPPTIKFVPMSSSSRSNLLHVIDTSAKTTRKFQPFTTSSRRSLLIPIEEQTSPNSINCSICRRNGEFFNSQQTNDNNVCSSTLISLSGNVARQSPLLVNCSLMSSCSSTFMTSMSSSGSSNSLKNCSYC